MIQYCNRESIHPEPVFDLDSAFPYHLYNNLLTSIPDTPVTISMIGAVHVQ